MAQSTAYPAELHPALKEWVSDNLQEDFLRVSHLTAEESKGDPPEEPYKSLYAARELLSGIKAKLGSCPEPLQQLKDYRILCSSLQLQIAFNYQSTEEMSTAEQALEASLRLLDGIPDKVKTAMVSMQAYNQLGILWGNRGEQQKALEYLLKAKAVYESHIAMEPPLGESEWLTGRVAKESEREKAFEGMHTHTLFYLAQVYGNLDQKKLMAHYCQTTLSRQLETQEYDAIEWSLNCATLSQYYIGVEGFQQARHCLASATTVFTKFLEEGERNGMEEDDEAREKTEQTRADLSRCWSKYCIALLRSSQESIEGTAQEGPRQKLFKFDTLEVANVEAEVSCDPIEDYEGAKMVFLCGQKHLQTAKTFFTLDAYASDHVATLQDHSLLYKLLAYFELDPALQCRMHKRRIDMLSPVLEALNPQYFLTICRQLMFELAEIYGAMAELKIITTSEEPNPHSVGKVNRLLRSGIHYYQKFVESFLEPTSGALPEQLEDDHLRPILHAKLHTARFYSRIISPDSSEEVRLSPYVSRSVVNLMLPRRCPTSAQPFRSTSGWSPTVMPTERQPNGCSGRSCTYAIR